MGVGVLSCPPDAICVCGHEIKMVKPMERKAYEEFGMNGGYRFTRGLEIIRALCECLGIRTDEEISRVWCRVIENDDVNKLHGKISSIDNYLTLITEMGYRFGKPGQASVLRNYIEERAAKVGQSVWNRHWPRVYYAMSSPFFALNDERFEIELASLAGGNCVNLSLTRRGKPGVNISPEELRHLNPEHIFISGLFSSTEEEFGDTCRKNGIWVDAVCRNQIHAMPPGWDFGNPRWILGAMHMANILHPDQCHFDMEEETNRFYRKFFQSAPRDFVRNRSFYQEPMETPSLIPDRLPVGKEMARHAGI